MQLLFKQRLFSWFDSYDIYDESGNTVYTVKGKLSWGHLLEIYDRFDNHIGTVQERVLTFLPKFLMYINGQEIGEIRKELTFFKAQIHAGLQWLDSGRRLAGMGLSCKKTAQAV